MDSVSTGLDVLLSLLGLLLLAGMYKPHLALWWEDRQYRLKVLKVYGTAIAIIFLVKIVLPRI